MDHYGTDTAEVTGSDSGPSRESLSNASRTRPSQTYFSSSPQSVSFPFIVHSALLSDTIDTIQSHMSFSPILIYEVLAT